MTPEGSRHVWMWEPMRTLPRNEVTARAGNKLSGGDVAGKGAQRTGVVTVECWEICTTNNYKGTWPLSERVKIALFMRIKRFKLL